MEILETIRKYLDEKYPANWHIYYGRYDGMRVEWTADNGAKCQMDAWTLLNKMIEYELKKNNKKLPLPLEEIILTHQD